jgi:hypothetical protein
MTESLLRMVGGHKYSYRIERKDYDTEEERIVKRGAVIGSLQADNLKNRSDYGERSQAGAFLFICTKPLLRAVDKSYDIILEETEYGDLRLTLIYDYSNIAGMGSKLPSYITHVKYKADRADGRKEFY